MEHRVGVTLFACVVRQYSHKMRQIVDHAHLVVQLAPSASLTLFIMVWRKVCGIEQLGWKLMWIVHHVEVDFTNLEQGGKRASSPETISDSLIQKSLDEAMRKQSFF